MNNYATLIALPIVLLCILGEYFLSKKRGIAFTKEKTAENFFLGMGQQVFAFIGTALFVFTYTYILNNHSLFKFENNALSFILVFIGADFLFYWYHRFNHKLNFLWAIHVVHHSSPEFNLSVSLRHPWIQIFFSQIPNLLFALLGFKLELMLLVTVVSYGYQFWTHTQMLKKVPLLEYVFVTPKHHSVHHGKNDIYLDKNFGAVLIIWDYIFGTYQDEKEQIEFGIIREARLESAIALNLFYWRYLFRLSMRTEKLQDKVKLFVGPLGWLPSDISQNEAADIYRSCAVSSKEISISSTRIMLAILLTTLFVAGSGVFSFSQTLILGFLTIVLLMALNARSRGGINA